MLKILRVIEDRFEEFLCSCMLGYIAITLNAEVFFRYILNSPSAYTDEVSRTLMIFIVFIGVPWAVKSDRHVIIDILPTTASWAKKRLVIEILSKILFIGFCVAFIMASYRASLFHRMLGSTTEGLGIPYWILFGMMPLIFSLTIVRLVQSIARSIRKNRKNTSTYTENNTAIEKEAHRG
ncbi:hypothetical protein A8C75_20615 [Marinobacterium aestuarii]|uniref:TRAP transporter small permease protein n=2 Tax=Marinobacterium aestuarii TaxID=1821621 RepID=A0A1A9F467_9GAMM|nr:hypothetical protein A8C75_20615 [Marinobacterium aestuarii]